MGICNGNFGHFSTKSAPLVPASFAAETRSFFPIFRAQENIPPTCARKPLILRALAGIIPRQVHTEWYRSGYNGPDSKSGVPATVPWVRIPPTPPAKEPILPDGLFCCFFVVGGIRKAALSGMPVACRNRRGFSAEKESHPHYQITGFSRSSGRGISYYGWGSKFILRSSKSHPLRQRAPLCTHSSFPETFVTALTLRSGKNARITRSQQSFTCPADDFPIHTKSKKRGG